MIFETDTTERLRIDTTGKVGIGTSSPSKTLHVAGTSIIGSGVNNITPSGVNDPSIQCQSIVLHNNSNTDQMYIRRIASAKYQFQTGNNTGELQLQPYGGNVGIGNTSTSYKLDVNGDINFTGDLRKNGSVVSLGGGSSGFSAGSNSKIIYFYQGGTFDLTNNRSTVGIGTDNPDSNFTLDVVGTDFRFGSGNYSNVWNSGNTADKLKFKLTGKNEGSGTEVGVYFASPGALAGAHKSAIIAKGGVGWSRNDLHFCVNTTTGDNSSSADATISHSKMMIDGENGNIGIGRTSPSYKLDVAGSIRADSTVYNSDDRIKNNESYITNATETIMKLKPQIYDKYNNFDMSGNYERESGLIAQEIYYDVSELRHLVNIGQDADLSNNITTSANPSIDPDYSNWGSEFAGVNYNGLIPYLIKSNQEQQQIINTEKAKAAALETKVQSLETQLASVLSRLTALENNS